MELLKVSNKLSLFLLILIFLESQGATLKDIFNLNSPETLRVERDSQYFTNSRYGAANSGQSALRPLKPEESPEAREDKDNTNVEKRCTRCDYTSRDYQRRDPYESRVRYDDRYDDRYRLDRYDDRMRDRYYDDYDRRPVETDRRYYEYDRKYDDRAGAGYDKYDRRPDPYERRPDPYERRPDPYDRDRRPDPYERYDRDRYDDRYRYYDKGYDRYDRGYRPYDETTRGSSGFDDAGRGYYFAVGRPDYGGGYGSSYASNWNYGGKRDGLNRDSDRGWRDQGFSSGSNRPRDPYDPWYNRGTSYLYGRPSSSTTTQPPSPSGDTTVTSNSQLQDNTSTG